MSRISTSSYLQMCSPVGFTSFFARRPKECGRISGARRSIIALLVLLVGGPVSAVQSGKREPAPCDDGSGAPNFSVAGTTDTQAKAFLAALQRAVGADDRRKVASMIRYPIIIWARNRNVLFRSAAFLASSYDLIFTAALKKTIAEARTECLFANWRGVMIHRGEIWMGARSNGELEIITINRPTGAASKVTHSRHALKVHPKVFSLIDSFQPDTGYPVVTEINLDAIAQNNNQFPPGEIQQEGEWISCENGTGFQRYRIVETMGNRYTVEYQANGGGSLTTSAIIVVAVEKRIIKKDGKAKSTRVLKVLGFSMR